MLISTAVFTNTNKRTKGRLKTDMGFQTTYSLSSTAMLNNFALWFISGFLSMLLWEVLPVDGGYSFPEKMKVLILFSIFMAVLQTFFFPTLTP